MLTINPPLTLVCSQNRMKLHEDLNEKILGNYQQMSESVRREELLFLTSQPPEIYFQEGGGTSILTEVNTTANQEIRLDVVNNLVNRIMLSGTTNFSYQDSVYISNTLRKLGITDVSNFMKQVRNLQEEKKENIRLLSLYEENKTLLKNLFASEDKRQEEKTGSKEGSVSETKNYYLHEDIYTRLQTGQIYEMVSSFAGNTSVNETVINRSEMNVAEQNNLSKAFLLREMKKDVYNSEAPINFYHMNSYEIGEGEEGKETEASDKLSSAILLNLVDQAYSLRINNIEKNQHDWYNVASSFFETAENTYKRYENFHKDVTYEPKFIRQSIEEINVKKHDELKTITEISNKLRNVSNVTDITNEEFTKAVMDNTVNLSGNTFESENVDIGIIREGDINVREKVKNVSLTSKQFEQLKNLYEDNRNSYDNRTVTNEIYQGDVYSVSNIRNSFDEGIQTVLRENADEYDIITEENIENLKSETKVLTEELKKINEQNVQNYRILQEKQFAVSQKKEQKLDIKKTRQSALRALENPEEVIREIMESPNITTVDRIQNSSISEFYNVLPEETRQIFELAMEKKENSPETVMREHPELVQAIEEAARNQESFMQSILEPPKDRDRIIESYEEKQKDTIRKITQNVNNIEEITRRSDKVSKLNLVHKEQETLDTEELMNAITLQKTETKVRELVTRNEVTNEQVVNNEVRREITNIVREQTDNVEMLVKQNINSQIGKISDEVYGKIEKKLQNERKRRGL